MSRVYLIHLFLCLVMCLPLSVNSQSSQIEKGAEEFKTRWVIPFLSNGSWGRGPHSNGESCVDCHRAGANLMEIKSPTKQIYPFVLKIRDLNGQTGHPIYGNELSRFGIAGKLFPEGTFEVHWKTAFQFNLKYPSPVIKALHFGPLHSDTRTSIRLGRDLTGIGLIDAIDEKQIKRMLSEQNALGLNGRINYVQDPISKRNVMGRFGYKASSPNLIDQISKAFRDELGVTSVFYPNNPCSARASTCENLNNLGGLEVSEVKIDEIAEFLKVIPTKSFRNNTYPDINGLGLFTDLGCDSCHRANLLATPNNSSQTFKLYTDLLLHDMGDGLADGLQEFEARSQDWRTAPLIGIGKHLRSGGSLLHDGRAQSIREAILWHDGEAQPSRDKYLKLEANQKLLLEYFIEQL